MSMIPRAPWRCAVYQICPSGPGAASCGRAPEGSWKTRVDRAIADDTSGDGSCAWAQDDAAPATPSKAANRIPRITTLLATLVSSREDTVPGRCREPAGALLVHRGEEVLVGLGILHLVEEEFHRVDRAHLQQDPAQDPHLAELVLGDQQLFLAGAGLADVERGEDALVGDLAVEDDFRVAGALELLEDHFVHPAAGVDQRGGDDRQRTAFLDVARGAEEALGALQRVGVDTT